MSKKILILTGGGDCPGLNAVIRAIVKRAYKEKGVRVFGSIKAFDGVLNEPQEIIELTPENTAGIHQIGGTILKTTTKGGPFAWPYKKADGSWGEADRSEELIRRLAYLGIDAVINIGGDGSQQISQKLFEMGLNVIGVPKTIDNDLTATDTTFGFPTAVQIATDGLDKLVTTAASHSRVMIMEVMGRNAGWIALNAAVAGGAEICLIPEIPYRIDKVLERIDARFHHGVGFCNIIVAEGAAPLGGEIVAKESNEVGYANKMLGGIAYQLVDQLHAKGMKHDIRVTVLGHLQRGGIPIAHDRIIATQFGVKAMELALEGVYGEMVAIKGNRVISVPLATAISKYNYVDLDSDLIRTARGVNISLGD